MPHGQSSSSTASAPKEKSRRQRNVESAKRSRDRLKNEPLWMHVQLSENEDRMRKLEKCVHELTSELKSSSRSRTRRPVKGHDFAKQGERPAWFGEPF